MGLRQPGTHRETSAAPEKNGTPPLFRETRADDPLLLAMIELRAHPYRDVIRKGSNSLPSDS